MSSDRVQMRNHAYVKGTFAVPQRHMSYASLTEMANKVQRRRGLCPVLLKCTHCMLVPELPSVLEPIERHHEG